MTMPMGPPEELSPTDLAGGARGPGIRDRAQGRADDAGKAPPEQVNYRPAEDPAMSCATCQHFIEVDGSCEVVAGPIDPTFTSDLFEPIEQALPPEPLAPPEPGLVP
jgi:hypothetical protein